jgi:hypothetical protein
VATDSSHARIRELNHSAPGGLVISQVPGLSLHWLSQVSRSRRWGSFPTTCFWPLPVELLSPSAAAAAFGSITMANLGGFAGPYAIDFLTDLTGTYVAGILLLVGAPSLQVWSLHSSTGCDCKGLFSSTDLMVTPKGWDSF